MFILRKIHYSTKPMIGWEERLWNDLFCVGWDVKS